MRDTWGGGGRERVGAGGRCLRAGPPLAGGGRGGKARAAAAAKAQARGGGGGGRARRARHDGALVERRVPRALELALAEEYVEQQLLDGREGLPLDELVERRGLLAVHEAEGARVGGRLQQRLQARLRGGGGRGVGAGARSARHASATPRAAGPRGAARHGQPEEARLTRGTPRHHAPPQPQPLTPPHTNTHTHHTRPPRTSVKKRASAVSAWRQHPPRTQKHTRTHTHTHPKRTSMK